jgi:ribokinase
MKPRLLVIGSANIDLAANMQRVPEAGETIISDGTFRYVPGGKGGNAAIAAARLGADTVFCTRVGNDTNGAKLRRFWSAEGIDTRFVFDDGRTDAARPVTGMALILVTPDGGNRIVVYSGANSELCASDTEEALTCLPDALVLGFEIPAAAILSAAKYARKADVPVIVDGGPARTDIDLTTLGPIEVFSPNETETEAYTGIAPESAEACLRASIRLAGLTNAKYIVLKLGGRGCFVYDGKYYKVIPARRIEPVDTTAAGDVFTAALALEYVRSRDIVAAATYATAAGTLTCMAAGASTSIPTAKAVAEFIAS